MTSSQAVFPVKNYNLDLTLASGQTFRWRRTVDGWTGVIGSRWVRLRQGRNTIRAETAVPQSDWQWLRHYLQTETDLDKILATFPGDPPLLDAVAACPGLRLLRQEPWECLASFICSSSKRITQIEQIVALLCRTFGRPVKVPPDTDPVWSFPDMDRLASASESELRACKLGFRAPYISGAAEKLAAGEISLSRLGAMPIEEARAALLTLPGVGHKIADCVLLFGYGFQEAFPIDVWILKALRQHYFPKRRPTPVHLRQFARNHFGPSAGYAQQYLYHHMRTARGAE